METLSVAVFLSVVANRLVEALIVPLIDKLKIDRFWLLYLAWLVSGVIVGIGQVNLFSGYIPDETAGRVLTIVVCGGGSNFIADLFQNG